MRGLAEHARAAGHLVSGRSPRLLPEPAGFGWVRLPGTGAARAPQHGQSVVVGSGSSASWRHGRDVLRHRTFAEVGHGSSYQAGYGAECQERYTGRVEVDARTGHQSAVASSRFDISWPEARVSSEARLDLQVDAEGFDVRVNLDVWAGDESVAVLEWRRRIPRRLA